MTSLFYKQQIVLSHPEGLHARVAAQVVTCIEAHRAEVFIQKGERRVRADSLLELLTLRANVGDILTLEAGGRKAENVIKSLIELLAPSQ